MKALKISTIVVFLFLATACTEADESNRSTEVAELKAKVYNLQSENEKLKERNEELTTANSTLIKEKSSLYNPFSGSGNPFKSFLFSNSTSFPFGYLQVTGYFEEILISDVDNGLEGLCPFFVVNEMDSDLSNYFWSMINKGNTFNRNIDDHIGLSLNLDDTPEIIIDELKSSSKEITVIGYLRDLELGGNMTLCNQYFTPLAVISP
ncbi:hypothetical protein B4O97_00985 [Marispirochaeta aestuarii]|uniref:Uncharacterized protein n=1 Tax=Marispirochaeta aestuarii TaxID=1963862 RepID=A0A1Y1S3A0_9SPIO|nr:bZIP transcription factor [Marispirochaeta aestuarii]ORC38363.1 hypothetical protein B4O97_00985 [Marispirochaeta aestuarii]